MVGERALWRGPRPLRYTRGRRLPRSSIPPSWRRRLWPQPGAAPPNCDRPGGCWAARPTPQILLLKLGGGMPTPSTTMPGLGEARWRHAQWPPGPRKYVLRLPFANVPAGENVRKCSWGRNYWKLRPAAANVVARLLLARVPGLLREHTTRYCAPDRRGARSPGGSFWHH